MKKGEFTALRISVNCKCGTIFHVPEYIIKNGRGKFCSKKCKLKYVGRKKFGKGVYKIVKENPTAYKKGSIPWNKGTVGVCKKTNGSIKPGERRSINTEFKKGDTSHNYKGNAVGYYALHQWIIRKKGKAKICTNCGTNLNVVWANLSHEYKRELSDYIELCCSCHQKHDRPIWGDATKRWGLKKTKKRKTI